jgi:DNA-binding LytR/AlgR family response regulator
MNPSTLYIKKGKKYQKVPVQDIMYLNAVGSSLHLITTTDEFFLSLNLSQFLRKNEIPTLARVHRSYLVNIRQIDSFDQAYVYMGSYQIPIGISYRHKFMERIKYI